MTSLRGGGGNKSPGIVITLSAGFGGNLGGISRITSGSGSVGIAGIWRIMTGGAGGAGIFCNWFIIILPGSGNSKGSKYLINTSRLQSISFGFLFIISGLGSWLIG